MSAITLATVASPSPTSNAAPPIPTDPQAAATVTDSSTDKKKKKKKKKKKPKNSSPDQDQAEEEEEGVDQESEPPHHQLDNKDLNLSTTLTDDSTQEIKSESKDEPTIKSSIPDITSSALISESPSNPNQLPEILKVDSKDLEVQAEEIAAKEAVELVKKKEEEELERKSSRAELVVTKRAKAISKKLTRISTYESLSDDKLNEDQVRSRASKPALEMALNELNEVSKVLALEKEEYKREEEEKIQVEVKKRLEKLQKESSSVVQSPTLASAEPIQTPTSSEPEPEPEPAPKQNSNPIPAPEATTTPLPPSSDTSLLPLLLQFLHLHSLALPTPGSKRLNPPLLPLALEKASPNEIAAIGSLYEKLANGPLLGGEGDAMDLVSKLEKGSEEKVFKTVSFKDILNLILSLTAPPNEPEILSSDVGVNAPISLTSIDEKPKTNGTHSPTEREFIMSQLRQEEKIQEQEKARRSSPIHHVHVSPNILFTFPSEIDEVHQEEVVVKDQVEEEEKKIASEEAPVSASAKEEGEGGDAEVPSKDLEPEGGAVDGTVVADQSEVEAGEKGGKGIVLGESPIEAKQDEKEESDQSASAEKKVQQEIIQTEIVQPSTTSTMAVPESTSSSTISSVPRVTRSHTGRNWADDDDDDDLGDPEEAWGSSVSTGTSTPAPLASINKSTPATVTLSPSKALSSKPSETTKSAETISKPQEEKKPVEPYSKPSEPIKPAQQPIKPIQQPIKSPQLSSNPSEKAKESPQTPRPAPRGWGKPGQTPISLPSQTPSQSNSKSNDSNTNFPKVAAIQNQKPSSPTQNKKQNQQLQKQNIPSQPQNFHQNQNQRPHPNFQHQHHHHHNQNGHHQGLNKFKPNGNNHQQPHQGGGYPIAPQAQAQAPLPPQIDEDGFELVSDKKLNRLKGRGGFALRGNRGGMANGSGRGRG